MVALGDKEIAASKESSADEVLNKRFLRRLEHVVAKRGQHRPAVLMTLAYRGIRCAVANCSHRFYTERTNVPSRPNFRRQFAWRRS
jgi:hypothetical protein